MWRYSTTYKQEAFTLRTTNSLPQYCLSVIHSSQGKLSSLASPCSAPTTVCLSPLSLGFPPKRVSAAGPSLSFSQPPLTTAAPSGSGWLLVTGELDSAPGNFWSQVVLAWRAARSASNPHLVPATAAPKPLCSPSPIPKHWLSHPSRRQSLLVRIRPTASNSLLITTFLADTLIFLVFV